MNDENNYVHPNVKAKNNMAAPTTKAGKNAGKSIEETYTKKTQLEHILLRPDTYIGSVDKQHQQMWVYDKETEKIVFKQIYFVPGLFKIFDEIIVNAADNKQRDPNMNRLEVDIDEERGSIRVWNNGNGIPIAMHKEHQIYVPELIFGQLLTGSNFDDNEAKTTGGRNGYGAKLANIFSTKFVIETADRSRNLKYKQTFSNNMNVRAEPELTKHSGDDFTCVTFYPDLKRFKMDSLDADIVALLGKRVFDIAGTAHVAGDAKKLSVYLNKKKIDAKSFESYISLYEGIDDPVAFEHNNERWEIGVGPSDGTFQQVSFVNSISTMRGGCHVNYIADQITSKLMPVVKKKNKGEEVKPNQIKNHLSVFVNALVVNPAFSSQTKDFLTTVPSAFGSTCVVSEKFMKQVEKSGIIENILNWAKFKQTAELKKKSGSKRSKLVGIPKLDDANCAGTAKSLDCTLILTEGDSAKALAISGLGVVGRDYYGVFPLKGKLLNVREASHQQIMKNEEIQNISKILGLTFGKVYTDLKDLRYGHLMIMTDQDHDGSHIKGLLINFLHHFWPSLLKIKGFLQQFITPIVKCFKGNKELAFYTIPEYHQWKEQHGEGKGWVIKYYKGLGTSTSAEAKEYFSNLRTHEIDFRWDEKANDMIEMAFAKKRVEDRKLWLLKMKAGVHIDYKVDDISYDDFINHELILFSHADNERSIPHFMDGLKPSQRKVLYSCFKRNLRKEMKVAQLAGYVSEHSAYHHGEASLTQTIVGMAQNFVGSNNINLLSPCGQFGTRLMGGKDAASARYVFTRLEAITRCIFHPSDDPLLDYLDDDGQSIEPQYYMPVIPMALVNGCEGIGTGWSSSVPTYDPRQIIRNLKKIIAGEEPEKMIPWYRGFTGDVVEKTGSSSFTISGTLEMVNETTVVISELPVGKWTTDYKQFLESLIIGNGAGNKDKDKDDTSAAATPFIKDFKENHTDTTVLFTVTIPADKMAEICNDGKGGLMKKFKLESSVSTTNMNLFDVNSQIRKFDSPLSIMREFYKVRIEYYDRRKVFLSNKLSNEWEKLDNQMRFVLAVIKGTLIVNNRKKSDLLIELKSKGFKTFSHREKEAQLNPEDDDLSVESGSSDPLAAAAAASSEHGYDYLLGMKIWSLTMEKVQELINQRDGKRAELDRLNARTAEDLWLEDLAALEAALDQYEAAIDAEKVQEQAARKKAKGDKAAKLRGGGGKPSSRVIKKKSSHSDEEDNDDDDHFNGEDSDFDGEKTRKKPVSLKAKEKAPKQPLSVKSALVMPTTSTSSSSSSSSGLPPPPAAPVVLKEKKPRALSSKPKPSKAKNPSKPITQYFKKKSKDDEDEDEDEEEDFSGPESVPFAPAPRTQRAAAVAALSKAAAIDVRGSDDDSLDFIVPDSDDDDEGEDEENDEEADSDIGAIKKKMKGKDTLREKPAPAPRARKNPAGKGVKRVATAQTSDVEIDLTSSPEEVPLKKKVKSASSTAPSLAPKAAKATKAAKAPPAKVKAVKAPARRKRVNSDDDDDDDSNDDASFAEREEAAARVTRPGRQTKQLALKKMVVEEEDLSNDEGSDFGDDSD